MFPAICRRHFCLKTMKYYYCIIILFLASFTLRAQAILGTGSVITLHPAIGPTITLNEKKKFFLFPQEDTLLFESALVIKYNDSVYSFVIRKTDGNRFEKFTTKKEIEEMYSRIEKLEPAECVVQTLVKKDLAPMNNQDELELLNMQKENDTWANASKNPPPRGSTHHSSGKNSFAADMTNVVIQTVIGLLK
jgi:hypothetical protein